MTSGLTHRPLRRVPMTWQDYLGLPDQPKAEWVDGTAVISPAVESQSHGAVVAELASVLTGALTEMHVLSRCGVVLPGNRLRTPDLTVVTSSGTSDWVEQVPVLVVEVLSRTSWSEDMVVKSVEYVRAGVGQYWTVDLDERTLDVDHNVDGLWRMLLRLDDSHPTGEVVVGEHQVPLDLRRILGD